MAKGFEQTLTMTSIKDIIKLMYALFSCDASSKWRLTVKPWSKKRSISANNQQHLWYNQIAAHNDNSNSFEYVKRFCKLTFGVPILLNSEKHRDFYETLFDMCNFWGRNHATRLVIMEGIEVTSKFNTAESKEYMEQMIFYFNNLDSPIPIKFKD